MRFADARRERAPQSDTSCPKRHDLTPAVVDKAG